MNYIKKYYFPDVVIGAQLKLDGGDATKTMQQFKKEIKDAETELLNMSKQFGATSKEALNAAKKVAELKDEIGDARALTDAFNPDQKFKALGQSLQGVLGGFTALTGVMGLLGVESENVQKQLLKVQSALALTQGLNQVGDAVQSFKNLGAQMLQTFGKNGLIGGAVLAGIAAITYAIASQKSEAEELEEVTLKQYEASKKVVEGYGLEERKLRALGVAEDEIIEKKKANIKITIQKALVELKALDAVLNATLESAAKGAAASATPMGALLGLFFKDGEDVSKVSDRIKTVKSEIEEFNVVLLELDKQQTEIRKKRKEDAAKDFEAGAGNREAARLGKISITKETDPVLIAEQQRADLSIQIADTTQRTVTDIEKANAIQRAYFAEQEAQAKIAAAHSIGDALGALSDLVGRQTAAGKALGIAQATINTWIGVTEVLRNKTVIPEPFGTIQKIASVTAIIASGLSAVRNIVKTQVPGGGGGGSAPSFSQVSAPLQSSPAFTNTRLDANQLNQIGNATVRAFVLEQDVTNSQERIRQINRAARI